jgi:Mrp family chromosome partitioning ATPase
VATELVGKSKNGTRLSGFAQIMSENPEVADAYDALFGALRLTRPLGSDNSILVTSTEPGEGKTTISSNLAIAASLTGQTVLLIDGDLRRFVGHCGSRKHRHRRTPRNPSGSGRRR